MIDKTFSNRNHNKLDRIEKENYFEMSLKISLDQKKTNII